MSDRLFQTRNIGGGMPTTRWSLVEAAGGDATRRREALECFAKDYWPAVYSFIRTRGHSPPEAEDLTQGFLVSLIERDSLGSVSREGVRFRSWLLGALKHFLTNDWRDRNRLKRGGGVPHLSIDRDLGESWLNASSVDQDSPDEVYERRWAWGVLERALAELTAAYRRDGREEVVGILGPLVLGIEAGKTYAEAAAELGISHANARVQAFRLRKHLRSLIREEVARTVGSAEEVEEELEHFLTLFGSP